MKALKAIILVLLTVGVGYFLAIDLFPGWFDDAAVGAFTGTGATICGIILSVLKKKAAATTLETTELSE